MPDIKDVRKIVDQADIPALVSVLEKMSGETREEVLKTISTSITAGKKAQTLNKVRTIIRNADGDVRNWVVQGVTGSYVTSLNETDNELRKFGVRGVPSGKIKISDLKEFESLAPHLQAVNAMISDAYLDFGNGMNGLVKGVEHQLNETVKKQIRAKVIAGKLTGTGIREIAKDIKEVLGQQGFSVLIDRGGRSWQLKKYGEMLARTHIIKSANEATLNRTAEFDIDIVEVSQHGGACDICTPYEGKFYSTSGKSSKYPKLEFIPPFHPYCRHILLPRPDLS